MATVIIIYLFHLCNIHQLNDNVNKCSIFFFNYFKSIYLYTYIPIAKSKGNNLKLHITFHSNLAKSFLITAQKHFYRCFTFCLISVQQCFYQFFWTEFNIKCILMKQKQFIHKFLVAQCKTFICRTRNSFVKRLCLNLVRKF